MDQEKKPTHFIQKISLFLTGIFLMIFPVLFTTSSTNPLILPKQALLGATVIILLVLQGVKILLERSVRLKRTYFDIPILLLTLFALLSSIFSVNRYDSLTAFAPFFFAILAFFLIVNIAKDKNSLLFLVFSLTIGSVLLSLSSIFSFFKISFLPLPQTTFSPIGSLLDQNIYLISVLAISIPFLITFIKPKNNSLHQESNPTSIIGGIGLGISSLIILTGIIVTAYSLFKVEKPLILPIETGFQTAFQEISLDSGRILQGFLLGSGIGTYQTDFSRWKQVFFNQNQELWNLTFFRSSSFVLELLATTGVLGFSSFIFLIIRAVREMRSTILQNKVFFSLLFLLIISILLPLSFVTQALFFIILGIFAVNQGLKTQARNRFFDIELQIVALKKGFIAIETPFIKHGRSIILPFLVFLSILIFSGVIGYFSSNYVVSDFMFQKSFAAASQNNSSLIYELQAKAISVFPYRDSFYRTFSQTSLAIANALASQTPQGSSPSAEIQQEIIKLIQQSIDRARTATAIAPQTPLNWQNLSSIYRAIIGFGQNAESFAIAAASQSVNLDPVNPQQYIYLGGVYYQLGQWDNAEIQFRKAISLKQDHANSYYNLGHALEQKGDLQNALIQYQIVRNLVINEKPSLEQINKEIEILEGKVTEKFTASQNETLNINTPKAKIPPLNPQVKIPAPNVATQSSK